MEGKGRVKMEGAAERAVEVTDHKTWKKREPGLSREPGGGNSASGLTMQSAS